MRRRLLFAMRRRLLFAVLLASIVGAAAFALQTGAAGGPRPVAGFSELSDRRPTASVTESPSGAIEAVLAERTERLGEVGRSEGRQSARPQRTTDWAAAVVVAVATIAALTITLARRRTSRTAVRAGRIAPARAPPLSLSFS